MVEYKEVLDVLRLYWDANWDWWIRMLPGNLFLIAFPSKDLARRALSQEFMHVGRTIQFSFWSGGRIAPPFPGDSQTMDWYQRSACSLLGFHFLKRSGVKLFSLVAIDEETFNLDDLVEAKMKIEIPVGKGIPTSRIVKVGDLQRPVYFRPIPVSAGTRVGQPNEMRLLQRKIKRRIHLHIETYSAADAETS